jgi:hypothetical protein
MKNKTKCFTAEIGKNKNKFRPQITIMSVIMFRSFAPTVLGGIYLLNKNMIGGEL